ncbi:MAG: ATP-dependent DNA ligase [Bacteroidia bacterium]|nr:ATP-dependent DNA ligase [Bacteroidia bacterium]
MRHFAQLVTQLDQTNKTNAKVQAMVAYLEQAEEEDKIWMMAMFSHRRPRRSVKTSLMREWASEITGIPLWLLEDSYHIVGDLAETLALLLPPPEDEEREEKSLREWMQFLIDLRDKDEAEKKTALTQAWAQLTQRERFVFNKLITGGFRVGVSQKLLVKALARHTGMDENAVAHRLMGSWTPESSSFSELLLSEDIGDDLSKPYPFYLAYQLEAKPQDLGNENDWQAEWKWDGIRSQLIKRQGEWYLWSRGEELITDKFPELQELIPHLPDGVAIDGELLPYKDGRPLSFQVLQTRIGRKNISKKILSEAPCLIMAYDLLEWEGQDLRQSPMSQRRELLEKLVQQSNQDHLLKLSPLAEFNNWDELAALREEARERYSEGLMLKKKSSDYKVGRKKGDWWKWKVDPLTVDAVMIYAQRGHGRRANLFSDYTFAVWDGDKLVPFTKAYSGLTDVEMGKVDAWIKKNTLERFGPVRSVKAELVFEIGFEGINRSKRHKSGVALRFPRMLRWRTDKKAEEANTLEDLHILLNE